MKRRRRGFEREAARVALLGIEVGRQEAARETLAAIERRLEELRAKGYVEREDGSWLTPEGFVIDARGVVVSAPAA